MVSPTMVSRAYSQVGGYRNLELKPNPNLGFNRWATLLTCAISKAELGYIAELISLSPINTAAIPMGLLGSVEPNLDMKSPVQFQAVREGRLGSCLSARS